MHVAFKSSLTFASGLYRCQLVVISGHACFHLIPLLDLLVKMQLLACSVVQIEPVPLLEVVILHQLIIFFQLVASF